MLRAEFLVLQRVQNVIWRLLEYLMTVCPGNDKEDISIIAKYVGQQGIMKGWDLRDIEYDSWLILCFDLITSRKKDKDTIPSKSP